MKQTAQRLRIEHLIAGAVALMCMAVLPMSRAVPLAVTGGVLAMRLVPRMQQQGGQRLNRQIAHEMPVVLDVLALALDAGVSWDRAARLGAACASGSLQADMLTASGRLALGAAADEVWHGSACLHLVGEVVERSFRSGGAVSAVLQQQADGLRARERSRRIGAVRRLESQILLPLTALGLPAFFIGGVVPVGASMAMQVIGQVISTGH